MEGGSYNKAVEIANNGDSSINDAIYYNQRMATIAGRISTLDGLRFSAW
ncbi:hypothetical protein OH492_02765 [Vibrio chagasii]|nr:hypothetical protein [Vibrio chagasii]